VAKIENKKVPILLNTGKNWERKTGDWRCGEGLLKASKLPRKLNA